MTHIKKIKASANKTKRMNREEWLAHALDVLEKEGGGALTIDALSRQLGVSRGSFYWHFKDRTDFIRQLVDYWSLIYTQRIAKEIGLFELNAEQRLMLLAEKIITQRLTRYDMAVRAWASKDSVAAKMVKKVDDYRIDFVRSLFAEIGFNGDELEMRTRTFVVYHSLESGLFSRIPRKQELKLIKLRHKLLTQAD